MVKKTTLLTTGIIALIITFSALVGTGYAVGNQPQVSQAPNYVENSNQVLFQTGVLAALIGKDAPAVTFYYQPDGGNVGKFRLTYNSIIAYNDTGNGIFDENEAVYKGILSSATWVTGPVMSLEDEEHGTYLMFSMNSSITMAPTDSKQGGGNHSGRAPSPIADWAVMTLTFVLANKSYTQKVSDQLAYNISGSTELKIGISLAIEKSIPAKNITLEQYLYENEDMNGNHHFRLHESTGNTSRRSGNRDGGSGGLVMHRFSYAAQLEQRIGFASSDEVEEGYYSWIMPVNLTQVGGYSSLVNFTTSYATSGSEMRLHYCLPYSASYESVYFDPVIGIDESAFLSEIADFVAEHSESLVAGLVVGSVIVIGVLYIVSRRESSREEDVTDLRNNPYYSGRD
jgi:hypothetical protein